jgi:hypothetical protein
VKISLGKIVFRESYSNFEFIIRESNTTWYETIGLDRIQLKGLNWFRLLLRMEEGGWSKQIYE